MSTDMRTMMVIDNFKQIRDLLKFESKDDFYLLEIILRKKDFPEGIDIRNYKTIDMEFITSIEKFDELESSIKAICRLNNARAYINLNRKSQKKTMMILMRECLTAIENDDGYNVLSKVTSAAAQCTGNKSERTFLLDVDTLDSEILSKTESTVVELGGEVKAKLRTLNGWHLITTPFDCAKFNAARKAEVEQELVTIKHNSPTVLYYESK